MDQISEYIKVVEKCQKEPTEENERKLREIEFSILQSEYFYKNFKLWGDI